MHDFIDVADDHPLRSRRAAIAMVTSICLHAVIFGILSQQLLLGITESSPPRSKKITLQILPAMRAKAEPESQEESIDSKPNQQGEIENKKTESELREPESNDRMSERIPSISSQQILTTARKAALQAAIQIPQGDLKKLPTIESKLADALNPKKEPPGVSTKADGTIRVVTDWGLVYCIRPADEYKISGPEDILPISMLCR